MDDKFPAQAYTDTVLRANFDDARSFFLASLFDIHYAHALMLSRQGILTPSETAAILTGLDGIDREELGRAQYDGSYEDFFFYLEAKLAEVCDPAIAGKLHTARSRNDIDITLYRMEVRRRILDIHGAVLELAEILTRLAEQHVGTVMPAHTHTQPAQPTTLAHFLLAAIEFLHRDAKRLQAAFTTVNENPLGACAITTTAFPIDRHETARLLAFEGLQTNSYGAIGATDYLLEATGAVSIAMVNLGKLLHTLLLWCTQEFGYLRLSNAYVQTSSIMPQKRNPVALEHARILASRAFAESQSVASTQHNTPLGDIVDSEDDLFPLVFLAFADAHRAFKLTAAAMASAQFDVVRLRALAGRNFLTVTELADTLVRNEGISFHDAHAMVAQAVQLGEDDSHARIVNIIFEQKPELRSTREQLLQALDPVHFVNVRKVVGGPAPERVHEELSRMELSQAVAFQWLETKRAMLESYRVTLRNEKQELLAAR